MLAFVRKIETEIVRNGKISYLLKKMLEYGIIKKSEVPLGKGREAIR